MSLKSSLSNSKTPGSRTRRVIMTSHIRFQGGIDLAIVLLKDWTLTITAYWGQFRGGSLFILLNHRLNRDLIICRDLQLSLSTPGIMCHVAVRSISERCCISKEVVYWILYWFSINILLFVSLLRPSAFAGYKTNVIRQITSEQWQSP